MVKTTAAPLCRAILSAEGVSNGHKLWKCTTSGRQSARALRIPSTTRAVSERQASHNAFRGRFLQLVAVSFKAPHLNPQLNETTLEEADVCLFTARCSIAVVGH